MSFSSAFLRVWNPEAEYKITFMGEARWRWADEYIQNCDEMDEDGSEDGRKDDG